MFFIQYGHLPKKYLHLPPHYQEPRGGGVSARKNPSRSTWHSLEISSLCMNCAYSHACSGQWRRACVYSRVVLALMFYLLIYSYINDWRTSTYVHIGILGHLWEPIGVTDKEYVNKKLYYVITSGNFPNFER